MKNLKYLPSILGMLLVVVCLHVSASGQMVEDKNKLAAVSATGSSVRWDVSAAHAGMSVTVAAPDGRVFRVETKSGASAEFALSDKQGNRLPDGQYTYELRLTPEISKAVKEQLAAARGQDDDPEDVRASRKRIGIPSLVESGGFSIVNGAVIVAGSAEEGARKVSRISEPQLPGLAPATTVSKKMHHPLMIATPDDVIPDDLIVQGSACVGLDCVNGEVFGFDTIRVKENNTRIQFDDTSAAGFPLNNWQIRANSSAAGGASFLSFVDQGATGNSETGTIVFEVDAGASANALKVSSTSKVGFRTATPVLDLHITTTDTPAQRLEQTNAGGFTAQTWDIAGNEANFFVRDVTGGSRLPFRIRPGAPTSSIDISASGAVGIGTASPSAKLHVNDATSAFNGGVGNFSLTNSTDTTKHLLIGYDTALGANGSGWLQAGKAGTGPGPILINADGGNVGIGTSAPTALLSVNGTANKPGGGSWDVFSDERLKNIKGSFNSGLKAVMQLQPLRYEYRRNNAAGIKSEGEHVGFGAQAVQKIIPEAVTMNQNGYLQVNNDPILWTMLNAIKEQQKEIEQLKGQIRQLRTRSQKRR
ncbi:MAG TPA: tail fiber domain-containing protein [Pyrinomonadaceae bacterium]|nr:tail fiber domain-containing protein [Pyrinomonadaceae bacterium]